MERTEWIDDPSRLAGGGLLEAWNRLAADAGAPFLRPAWFSCWWDAFGASDQLAICVLWRGRQLAAVFPLSRRGRRLCALANAHTPFYRPLAVDAAALESVVFAAIDSCGELELAGVPDQDPAIECVQRASVSGRRLTVREHQHVSPVVDTSGDAARYLAERRSDLREVARRRRKMHREHRALMQPIQTPGDWEAELDKGLRLEESGWKGRSGTAILSDPPAARFYRAIAATFHATNELRWSSLELDGRLTAFDFALVTDGRYWLVKTAYDEARADLGPGIALRLAVIERCFELGLERHEFLGDDMPYKRRFSDGARRHLGLRSYSRNPRGALGYLYRRGARPLLRRSYRQVRPAATGRGERR